MQILFAAAGLLVAMALSGCADEANDACGLIGLPPPPPGFSSNLSAEEFVGKTLTEAEALAGRQGGTIRVFGSDANCAKGYTEELNPDRVNVYLQDDRVTEAATF